MKKQLLFSGTARLLGLAIAGLTAVSVQAAITIATNEAASFVVSSNDLLQTAFSASNTSPLDDAPGGGDTTFLQGLSPNGEASLRDGVWQDEGTQGRGAAMVQPNEFAEFFLDLTASPGGYSISGVDLYSNWGTGQGRDRIQVSISFSLVGTTNVFDQVLTNGSGTNVFIYNPPTLTQAKMSITGIEATNVAGIRFDWPTPQENNGVGYSELDVFGNAANAPPALSSTDPISGATNVATISDLVLTFNEDIQAGTGNVELYRTNPVALVESFDVTSSSQLSFSGTTLTIDPTSDLLTGVEYYVLIASGVIEDLTGNAFAGIAAPPDPGAFSFTTDNTAPSLVAGELLLNKLPTSDLTIPFDEPVQTGIGNITIHLASNSNLVETIDVTGGAVTTDGNVAIVDIADLAFGESYFANIDSNAITDLSGIGFAGVADSTTLAFSTVPTTFIHHWEFEGDGADSVGNHDGTLVGGGFTNGVIGQARYQPSVGNRVRVDQSSLPASNLTLACWVNPSATTSTRGVAGTQRDEAGIYLRLQSGGTPTVILRSASTNIVLGAGAPVTTNEWTHLAYTVDAVNGLTLYVDGSPVATNPSGTNHTVTDNFKIGNRPDVIGDNYQGLIDDVRIYASVLSLSEIQALAGITPLVLKISENGGDLDFEWNSTAGMQYDLVSSTTVTNPVSTWAVYDDGINPPYENIPATGTNTVLTNVPNLDPGRFFALFEEEMPPLLSEDFEAGASIPAGWSAADNGSGTAWEVGDPSTGPAGGPTAAANGTNCAGSNISAAYTDNTDITLTSPAFLAPAGGATLTFQQLLDTDQVSGGSDFGSVRLLDADNSDAEIIAGDFPVTPIEGYGAGWTAESFTLPAAALGKNIKVQFQFVSNGDAVNYAGFYIDDVLVAAPTP